MPEPLSEAQVKLLADADEAMRMAQDPAVQHDQAFVIACIVAAAERVNLARLFGEMNAGRARLAAEERGGG